MFVDYAVIGYFITLGVTIMSLFRVWLVGMKTGKKHQANRLMFLEAAN